MRLMNVRRNVFGGMEEFVSVRGRVGLGSDSCQT